MLNFPILSPFLSAFIPTPTPSSLTSLGPTSKLALTLVCYSSTMSVPRAVCALTALRTRRERSIAAPRATSRIRGWALLGLNDKRGRTSATGRAYAHPRLPRLPRELERGYRALALVRRMKAAILIRSHPDYEPAEEGG
jgi:hypothetical protein